MTAEQQAALKSYLADAEAKLAELPQRTEEEIQLAADEGRKPRAIRPLTEVDPAVLGPLLAEVKNCPPDLKEAHRTQSRVCRSQNAPYAMLSEQLAGLLKAAGISSTAPATKPE